MEIPRCRAVGGLDPSLQVRISFCLTTIHLETTSSHVKVQNSLNQAGDLAYTRVMLKHMDNHFMDCGTS